MVRGALAGPRGEPGTRPAPAPAQFSLPWGLAGFLMVNPEL